MPLRRSLPVVADDLHRHARARAHLFQHRRHPQPRTVRHHLHGQHRHVAMPGRIPGLGQPTGADAEHHQTFQLAQGHRVIDDENPVVVPRRRTPQHAQAQPAAPIQDGGRNWDARRQVARQQAQNRADPATAKAGMQIQLQAEPHHLQGVAVVGEPCGHRRHGGGSLPLSSPLPPPAAPLADAPPSAANARVFQ